MACSQWWASAATGPPAVVVGLEHLGHPAVQRRLAGGAEVGEDRVLHERVGEREAPGRVGRLAHERRRRPRRPAPRGASRRRSPVTAASSGSGELAADHRGGGQHGVAHRARGGRRARRAPRGRSRARARRGRAARRPGRRAGRSPRGGGSTSVTKKALPPVSATRASARRSAPAPAPAPVQCSTRSTTSARRRPSSCSRATDGDAVERGQRPGPSGGRRPARRCAACRR